MHVGQMLRQGAIAFPERVAVVERIGGERRELTYGELDLGARRVAHALEALGLQPGDRVALSAANSASFMSSWFGILYAGCVVVPVPVLSAAPELAHRLLHAGCRALLVDEARRSLADAAAVHAGVELPILDSTAEPSQGEAIDAPRDVAPQDTAMVLYTSGTTGVAKGAAIPHASLFAHTAILCSRGLGLDSDDRVLGVLPMTHSYGCRMLMLATFYAGARCVLMDRFDAGVSLEVMRQEAVTWVPAVPTMYAAWGNQVDGPAAPALRWCMCAGAPLPDETARRAEARLGAEVRQGFGMTEATICTLNAPPDVRVLGSVGKPVWGIEVRVVDDAGADCEPGADGQVIVRGHNMMSGYLDDPEATAEAMRDGWMHTGDVGRFDGDGRLSIVDRVKDMIIRGGNNVYPSEVEAALCLHPAIAQAAVVGRPDAYYGEEIVAVLILRDDASLDAAAVRTWAAERVARTKLPREVAFVDRFPVGPSGKVLKRTLRDELVAGTLKAVKVAKG